MNVYHAYVQSDHRDISEKYYYQASHCIPKRTLVDRVIKKRLGRGKNCFACRPVALIDGISWILYVSFIPTEGDVGLMYPHTST